MSFLSNMKKELLALASIVGMVITFLVYFESRYAFAKDVKVLKQDVLQIKHDRAVTNYYDLKVLLQKYPTDEELKKQVDKAKAKLDTLKSELDKKEVE